MPLLYLSLTTILCIRPSAGNVDEKSDPTDLFIDKDQEAEAAFWRLKRAADRWRENRVKRVLAQEGESIFLTLGRVVYAVLCIIFDGLILVELPIMMGRTAASWALYMVLLILVVRVQYDFYQKWFSVDISQIDFDQE